MAHPPRIPNLLPLELETIYFLTLCVSGRKPVLNNLKTWQTIHKQLERLQRWKILAALAMPDHLHLLAAPLDREDSVHLFFQWFKRGFNQSISPNWNWQHGGFDRLLRSTESAQQKWEYIRQNPVRADLVQKPEDWPYQFGLSP
jgi:putative transposase